MSLAFASPVASPAARKRGPKTPEGKARSRMNAVKHGLRARTFALLPEESAEEWARHLDELRAGYGPVDAAEEKLVAAIAAAMWHEIRAHRTLAETLAGLAHGALLQEPGPARALGTALRYLSAAVQGDGACLAVPASALNRHQCRRRKALVHSAQRKAA